MNHLIRATMLGFLIVLALTPFVQAEEQKFEPLDGESLEAFQERVKERVRNSWGSRRENYLTEKTGMKVENATSRIAAQPSTPSAGGGFGSRVSGSLSDFLPYLNFAVDAIDTAEDQKSVTVSFSPVKVGEYGEVDVTAKISEPEPFETLLSEIPEAARASQKEAIAKQLGDYSDVLLSATYGLQWKVYTHWSDSPRMLFGRNPALYEKLIHELMSEVWPAVWSALGSDEAGRFDSGCQVAIEKGFNIDESSERKIEDLMASDVKKLLANSSECPWEDYVELLAQEQAQIRAGNEALLQANIDQLAPMIDNQPQLTLTASLRDRDPLVGQDESSVMLKFELGTQNLNSALREYRRMKERYADGDPGAPPPSAKAAFDTMAKRPYDNKDKLTIALVWRQRDAYSETYDFREKVTDPATGAEVEFPRMVSLNLEERDEWCGMAQWSRSLPKLGFMQDDQKVVPRVEGAIEYVNVQGDPKRQNRFVARLSYLSPGPKGMTFPITLTWADKSEFLGEQDKTFGAHFGISYKFGS